jgi:hypothetical protein
MSLIRYSVVIIRVDFLTPGRNTQLPGRGQGKQRERCAQAQRAAAGVTKGACGTLEGAWIRGGFKMARGRIQNRNDIVERVRRRGCQYLGISAVVFCRDHAICIRRPSRK